jgi:hypothetical protein
MKAEEARKMTLNVTTPKHLIAKNKAEKRFQKALRTLYKMISSTAAVGKNEVTYSTLWETLSDAYLIEMLNEQMLKDGYDTNMIPDWGRLIVRW